MIIDIFERKIITVSKIKSTFERYEKKYILSSDKYFSFLEKIDGKMKVDDYGEVTICNVYFDTKDSRLIRYSLDKPIYKEKLRMRSYGIPNSKSTVFIELKKKYKGVVYKRREKMIISEAENYLYKGICPSFESQVLREVNWFLSHYERIIPSMYISYDRVAMYGIEDSEIRITFDKNILWRDEELDLKRGSFGSFVIDKDKYLMEVKITGGMPFWLYDALNSLEIYPRSFSKYGTAYQIKNGFIQIGSNETINKYISAS